MVTSTPNLALSKYGPNDNVNIAGINANFDKLDLAFGKVRNFRLLADITLTATVTPTNLFTIPCKQNQLYLLNAVLLMSYSAPNANISMDYTVSGGAVNDGSAGLYHLLYGLNTGNTSNFAVPTSTITMLPAGTATAAYGYSALVKNTGTDGGSLIPRIFPAASVAGTLTIKAGSYIEVAAVS